MTARHSILSIFTKHYHQLTQRLLHTN
uniref:Uncharacterized protein n=1 Tax=Lepeophtheirus salmonis TaxID=72036 RepID=A0A0K2VK86_LEPSM